MLSYYVTPYRYVEFKEHNTVKYSEYVGDLTRYYNYKLNWDKSFYDSFAENPSNDYDKEKMSYYEDEIVKDYIMLSYLDSIPNKYPDLFNDIHYKTYKLSYLYINDSGERVLDICFGRFDKNGNLYAFKENSNAQWNILGKPIYMPEFDPDLKYK